MERIGPGETLHCSSLPDVVVEIEALFRDLPTVEQVLKRG